MRDNLIQRVVELKERFQELRVFFNLDKKNKHIAEIEEKISQPGFWDQGSINTSILKELKILKESVGDSKFLERELKDLKELIDISTDEEDNSLSLELKKVESEINRLEFKAYLSEPHDSGNAIMSIHAGAGGTESCDWTQMLIRMYSRWVEKRGYKIEMLDILEGEEAGVKNATFIIKGDYVYGFLKAEKGVHRLVRISPFDANKRRHTSFALVEVLPEVEDIEVNIDGKDLRIDTFRSSGAGGQHVNVTDSAIRITHNPTGIVVECQNERSQHKNKATAMKVLRSKLYDLNKEKQKEELQEMRVKGDIGWGYQIRSYVLHPYTMAKDHRTGLEVGNVQGVLNGNIDGFIEAYLKKR
ncbi:MAG: peptide chain release factor 2 [Candidatus Kaelpia imicola]|nr:peptide chain release factor 2 [Candidatus Kaelpia imicola]